MKYLIKFRLLPLKLLLLTLRLSSWVAPPGAEPSAKKSSEKKRAYKHSNKNDETANDNAFGAARNNKIWGKVVEHDWEK